MEMELERTLLRDFAQITNDESSTPKQYVRGTVVGDDPEAKYVRIDGSTTLTPISEVVDVQNGDRVLVSIENHTATIIGNFTFPPSARKEQEALDKAEEAKTAVGTVVDKAEEAITQSSVASAIADEAKQEAEKAVAAAEGAKEAMDNAVTSAGEAKEAANEAHAKAEEAIGLINATNKQIADMNADVADAKANAEEALQSVKDQAEEITTIKNKYSTKQEINDVIVELEADFEAGLTGIRTEFSEKYATQTEMSSLESTLSSQISQTAGNIESAVKRVESLESDTEELQNEVDAAKKAADDAQERADAAHTALEEAQAAAEESQRLANEADTRATNAMNAAIEARKTADEADALVQSAQVDLQEAQMNYEIVSSNEDSTAEEIAAAQALVNQAQEAVNKALADAATAEAAANTARKAADEALSDATKAHQAALEAQYKATAAQNSADIATEAANKTQADLAALTRRVVTAETNISQNAENITLSASRIDEIGEDLEGNYYRKEETDAAIKVESGEIQAAISQTINDSQVETIDQLTSVINQTASELDILIKEIKQTSDSNANSIVNISSNQMNITSEFTEFVQTTKENITNIANGKVDVAEIKQWAKFENGELTLGGSNTPFTAVLANSQLSFCERGKPIAWISNNELHVLNAIITKSIGCGNFMFVDEGDLGFSLI